MPATAALINDFLSLIYPRHCEACRNSLFRHENYLCNQCRAGLPESNYHKMAESPLARKFYGRIPLERATCLYLFEKSGRVQRLLHAIKYQEQKLLAEHLGAYYGEKLAKAGTYADVDVIIPVPLHRNKLRKRGFNQSEWFAKGLGRAMNLPVDTQSFIRIKDTSSQTRKSRYARWENVDGIFSVTCSDALKGKHVLLADDVITTGATLEASWEAMKPCGDVSISVCSIAFAEKNV